MNRHKLAQFFEKRREAGVPLVLATVYDTVGSTYSKPGARMLIDADGIFQGMLSGGCLEGDLAIRAKVAVESGRAQYADYNLADSNDELWGLGVGCDGRMRILLQPLTAATGYEPFASIARTELGLRRTLAITLIEPPLNDAAPGATLLVAGGEVQNFGFPDALCEEIMRSAPVQDASDFVGLADLPWQAASISLLYSIIHPTPRVLVLGAGLDAEPVVSMAAELGWLVTVADHRPAYVENNNFAGADRTLCLDAEQLAQEVELDEFDLAIVMSHHLASDRKYLAQLSGSRVPYIGLLGPKARRRRLLDELGERAQDLRGRLHGPAGLDLGGSGPAAIALSIIAQMQQFLGVD